MALDATLTLNTGAALPQVGFGTYTLKGDAVRVPLRWALEAGYRLVDTAWIYDNEADVGAVWPEHCPREQLFLTSKLWRSHQSSAVPAVLARLRQSLRRLRTDYLDLWLLHWPGPGHHRFQKHQVPQDWTPAMRLDTWRAMEEAQRQGLVRAIGVSNFTAGHLRELLQHCSTRPAVNQVELHPLLAQQPLREFCHAHGIVLQAYASLGTGNAALLRHETVTAIAAGHGSSAAQVLLRWAVQHRLAVIPRSTQRAHIEANRRLAELRLSEAEMAALDAMDADRRFCWNGVDPATVPLLPADSSATNPKPVVEATAQPPTRPGGVPPQRAPKRRQPAGAGKRKADALQTAAASPASPPTPAEPLPQRRRFAFAPHRPPDPACETSVPDGESNPRPPPPASAELQANSPGLETEHNR
eukprot:EG_transcript_13503